MNVWTRKGMQCPCMAKKETLRRRDLYQAIRTGHIDGKKATDAQQEVPQ